MHQVLEVQEILGNVFSNLSLLGLGDKEAAGDLARLARTCHSFKEPALDELWRTLWNSGPLARCLPDASHYQCDSPRRLHSFRRPLSQTEWNILQGYTRRIRCIQNFNGGLDWESVKTFFNPPTTKPLFPNLRSLRCGYTEDTISLLRLPLPSLVTLHATVNSPLLLDSVKSLPETSPEIRTLAIFANPPDTAFKPFFSRCICRWRNLQVLTCRSITLDADVLKHLSCMPALTTLSLVACRVSLARGSSLILPHLIEMSICHGTFKPISPLLYGAQLPAITNINVTVDDSPAEDLAFFLDGLPASNTARTLEIVKLKQPKTDYIYITFFPNNHPIGFANLQPCMVFGNLCHLDLDVECYIDLTENQLLALASAWPKLRHFKINEEWGWGWHLGGGVTPGGLIQLLEMCRSLEWICIPLILQGYMEVPSNHMPMNLGLTFPALHTIDVLDSKLEAESVTAITSFLSGIAACSNRHFALIHQLRDLKYDHPEYMERWREVNDRVKGARALRWSSGSSDS